MDVAITVNGVRREADVEPRTLLVDFLRDDLGLTGTKIGCDTSQCGACTVHLDGKAVKSCTVLAVQADGGAVTTIEGLAANGDAPPGAGGVLGAARPPVRLLHARDDHGRDRAARGERRARATRRSGTRSRATSAGAPATRTSSAPSTRRRARGGELTMATDRDAPPGSIGAPVKRVEDPRLITGAAQVPRRPQAARDGARRDPALAVRARPDQRASTRRSAAAAPGVVAVFTGKDFEHLNPLPCAWQAGGVENFVDTPRALEIDRVTFTGAGVAAVVAETQVRGRGRARADRGRLGAARRRRRRRGGGAPTARRSSTRTRPGNIVMDWSCGDAGRDRQGARRGRRRRQAAARQPAADPERRWRRAARPRTYEPSHRRVHGLDDLAGPAHHAAADDGVRVRDPRDEDALHRAARRRRLRHEDLPLPRVRARGRPRREGRAAGQVGRDAERELHGDDARPRPRHLPRGRREARRHDHRAQGEDATRTSAASSRRSRRASRRRSTGGCSPAPTGSRTSTARCSASTRTPAWSTPTAAPGGPRRPTSSSGPSTSSRASSTSTRSRCGAGTSSRRTRSRTTRGILNGLKYDTGDYEKALDRALEIVGYDGLPRASRRRLAQQGRYLGIGFSTYVEICGAAPSAWIGTVGEGWGASMWESANIRVHLTGKVAVTIGTQPQGQGHETTVSQVVATELGIPIEDVTVEHRRHAGHAVRLRHLREPQRRRRRGRRLQQPPEDQGQGAPDRARTCSRRDADDIVFEDGKAFVKGAPDNAKTIQEIAGCGRARVRPARGRGAVPRRHDLLRPAELHVPVRDAHRGRRDRRRDGRGDARRATSRSTTSAR